MPDKIVIIGMCNPQSTRPEHALWTQPPGCTGHRLWQLATARTGVSEDEWLAMTDRRNLCTGSWDRARAREQAEAWRDELAGRTVIQLGLEVLAAMRCYTRRDWPQDILYRRLEWQRGRDWIMVPHTSGLSHFYNADGHRAAVEILLQELIEQWRAA